MPKELLAFGLEKLTWQEYAEPELSGDQVRIRSEFGAAKHGTELAFLKGYSGARGRYDNDYQLFIPEKPPGKPAAKPPARRGSCVGNMTVGTVTEVGPEVKELSVGDRVLLHGGFRQTHVAPEQRCWKLPGELSWKSAVCLDPADFALGAVRDGNVRVGDAVAVFGMGAIGLMVVQIAKVSGAAPVIAVEPLPRRGALAKRLGADLALNPTACDAGLEIKKATGGRGVDVAIDYSGARQALQQALRGAAYGGTVVAGAFPPPYDAGLDFGAEAHLNVPNLIFSRSCSEPNREYPRWNEGRIFEVCLRLLIDGRISGEEVVTPVVKFEDAAAEYPKIATEPDTYVKIGVEY